VTVIGLQAVGLILVIAFLITPPTAARFWTNRLLPMILLSAIIGGVSGWLGASISALTPDLPAGAVIVLVAAILFLISMMFAPARGVFPRLMRQAHLRRKVNRQHLLRAAYEILESIAPDTGIKNSSFPIEALRIKRAWSPEQLKRVLRVARREDHLEPVGPGLLRLSEPGFGEAARITRNHRLWERYLIKYADIAPSHVDRDADLVEHILGADLVSELEADLKTEIDERNLTVPVPASPHLIKPEPPAEA
jgi:manganese/zinc/iron transport system permease protein